MFLLFTCMTTLFLLAEAKNVGPYENFTKPVTDVSILNVTWHSITVKFFLHPELKTSNTTYIVTVRNSSSFYYQHNITLINYGWLSYKAIRLAENALFYINIQIQDGPSLEKDIECRTKVKYPPPTSLSIQNISADSAVVEVVLPTNDLDFTIVTEFKVKCIHFSSFVTFENFYNISDYLKGDRKIIITNLNEFTNYTVLVATGDGKVFGMHKIILFKTKVKYPPPTYLSVLKVSSDSAVIEVVLPTNDLDSTIVTDFKIKCVHMTTFITFFESSHKIMDYIKSYRKIIIANLTEFTNYSLFVATGNGKEFGSYKNISFQTKVKYPSPTSLSVYKISLDTVIIGVVLPSDMEPTVVTTLKVKFSSVAASFENLYDIKDYQLKNITYLLKNLVEFTDYDVLVSTGNGTVFGVDKKISFQTKARPFILYCKNEKYRGVTWPTIPSGRTISLSCPRNSKGNVSRKCVDGVWQKADIKNCKSDKSFSLSEVKSLMDISKESVRLSSYVKDSIQFGSDLSGVIDAVESLVKSSQKLSQQLSNFSETMLNITNHLLGRNSTMFWNDLPKDKQSKDAIKLLRATDDVIETAFQLNNHTSKVISSENMVINIKKLLPGEKLVRSLENTVQVPEYMLTDDGKSTLVVATFNRLDKLIGIPEGSKLQKFGSNLTLNSKIMTVSIFPQRPSPFINPVVIVQKLEKFLNGSTPNCVYLDNFNGSSFWSDNGCKMIKFNESHVTCHCSHLTNFAVLMSVTDAIENLSETHVMVMDMITAFGLSISLITLMLSFLSFLFIKTIKSLRNTIHKNVVFALFVAELIFLLGIDKTGNKIGCQVIAVLLHYFFLASFFLMAFEGIVLYMMLVQVFKLLGNPSIQAIKYIAACWVFPGLVVIVNLLIDYNAYGKHRNHCWLSVKSGFIWSFVGPVLFVIFINILIFIKSLHVVSVKSKKRTSNIAELWFWIKSTFLLICLLGITWIVGIFYIDSRSLFFGYVFTIINSLQGFLIFLFHCVFDSRVRKAWYDFFCCKFGEDKDLNLLQSRINSTSISSRFSFSKKSRQSFSSIKKIKKDDTPENSLALLTANSKC
ncbi:adhesion G protein-coupled receptor L2 isoform X2 [Hydra vulgaris]|uniref:adhesion G protein-coupled receptor L2 isoform X2 n=1 Tax=Hydra vulgaris TaxID=6087 RepID=UPI001F5E940A|nr:adhesion G protein-coupled receptor L2-like isoform X2 [Hydra vulgaris]